MKTGPKLDPRIREYMERYGVAKKTVKTIGVEQLDRMAEHARATMFSSLKWGSFRGKGGVSDKVPGFYRQRLAREREEAELRREQRRREKVRIEALRPTDRRHFEWLQSLTVKRRDVVQAELAAGFKAPDPRGGALMELVEKIKRRVA